MNKTLMGVLAGTVVTMGGCTIEGGGRELGPGDRWFQESDTDVWDDASTGTGGSGSGDTGAACTAEALTCTPPAGKSGCVPKNLYGKVAASEYFNECRNYCHADDRCFDRATAMLHGLHNECSSEQDIRGGDKTWCGEFSDPKSTGTCDDLAYKVIIRYPAGGNWSYHIATLVNTCESGQCVIDPLGDAVDSPTTSCLTPQQWCTAHAHGKTVVWHDTNDKPPAGKVYCEIAPGDQEYWDDGAEKDPTAKKEVDKVCLDLKTHVYNLCVRGLKPFPSGCGADKDKDGIPDKWDKCPDTPAGKVVDYCDEKTLGCADGETPGGNTGTGTGSDTGGDFTTTGGYPETTGGPSDDVGTTGGPWTGP